MKSRNKLGRLAIVSLILLSGVYAGALYSLRPPSDGVKLTLGKLNQLTVCAVPRSEEPDLRLDAYCQDAEEKVLRAKLLDQDSRIIGKLAEVTGGAQRDFWASYPKSDAATNDLLRNLYASGADVSVDPQTTKALTRFLAQFLLPLVMLANLFALLFVFLQKDGSGVSEFLSFGRAGDKRQDSKGKGRLTFADVAAADEAVVELAEVRDYLADPTSFAKLGALPPKGVLLFGPPGCGKTLLARAVAGEVDASFFSMSGSEFVEALVGIGAARVRDLFARARAAAPAIIFIDELDGVGRKRGAGLGQGHDEREQTLNELLTQIDGFSPSQGIVVMGATNRPDILDPALLRAGRFDRHITVERPDVDGRLEILRLHASGRPLVDQGDLTEIATTTAGFTGADLANVLNESALLAVREKRPAIELSHLQEAVERVLSGPRLRRQIMSDDEKSLIAYHEAGHAVVAAALGNIDRIHKLSIIARGAGVGHLALLAETRTIIRRRDIQARIMIALGGAAAEELVYGEPSSGGEADLERATTAARDMAGRYGMSRTLGRARLLAPQREVFLGRDYLSTQDVSQPTLELLDLEVRQILDEQMEAAASVLRAHRPLLDDLAARLVAQETLSGQALKELLQRVLATPAMAATAAARPGRKR